MKNFSNVKNEIETKVNELLQLHNLKIYEVNNYIEFENDIIQILVEDLTVINKPLDFEILSTINDEVSNLMDQIIVDSTPYMLEVASAGVEKIIRTQVELTQAIDQYVNIVFNTPINGFDQLDSTIQNYDQTKDVFEISYFIKGQKKKQSIKWSDIKVVRYAIKF